MRPSFGNSIIRKMPYNKPHITGEGTNAQGNDWKSYSDGSFQYKNSGTSNGELKDLYFKTSFQGRSTPKKATIAITRTQRDLMDGITTSKTIPGRPETITVAQTSGSK